MDREVKCELIKTYYDDVNEKTGEQVSLRVVSYNGGRPVLEKKSFYYDHGIFKPGKKQGVERQRS